MVCMYVCSAVSHFSLKSLIFRIFDLCDMSFAEVGLVAIDVM